MRQPYAAEYIALRNQGKKVKPNPPATKVSTPKKETPKNLTPIIKDGQSELRQLAKQRALLTNQLVDPGTDSQLIAKNCEVLDRLKPTTTRIAEIAMQNENLRKGVTDHLEESIAKEDNPIMVSITSQDWRMQDLIDMNITDLKNLKNRLQELKNLAEKRSLNRKYKPKTRDKNKTAVAKRTQEIRQVSMFIVQKEYA